MKNQIKLKWKIGKYLLIFGGCLLALLWVFQTQFLQPMYESYKVQTTKKVAKEIVNALESESLQEVIYSLSAQNDTCIRIINSETDVMAGNVGCALYHMTNEQILSQISMAQANGNSYLYQSGFETNNGERMKSVMYTVLVETASGKNVVMVYSGISPINATTQTLTMQLWYIGIIIILAVLFLTYLLNRKIAKPLTEITQAAKTLPQGTYEPVSSSREYQEASTLNTTLQEASVQIQKADKAKRDLIANVSHDLRTPLTMIGGYGEMMRDLPNEKTDANLQVIIDESKRLTNLVNDLLDLSKLQEKQIQIEVQDFDLSSFIENEMKKYEVYRVQDGFTFEVHTQENVWVSADPARIEQVFHNFMTNAINYSGDQKKIIVQEQVEGAKVKVSVQDFGEGIEEKDLQSIWDRYYKIDKEHVRVSNGSGIGLAICKEILELHHVEYGVDSTVGKGSTFWFYLPTKDEKAV